MLCAIVLISKLSANCDIYDSYESAMSDNLLIKRECESLLGGGGTYHSDLIEANKSARVSCDGIIREDAESSMCRVARLMTNGLLLRK